MSVRDVGDMTVPELVDEFRRLADELGTPWDSRRPGRFERTPERAARIARMNALTPEMRRRAPPATISALMLDPEVDVRMWAAMRFSEIDRELSNAAFAGAREKAPPREALALIEHARTPPPAQPTLAQMSVDDLVARFSDACLREFWTRHCGRDGSGLDEELRYRIDGEVDQIVAEIRRRGACDRLLPLLDSPNITTRAEAARATIRIAPERAVRTLEAVSDSKDSRELGRASMSLWYYEHEGIIPARKRPQN
ncbi:uncharacterized protein DUF2019 [Roseiarcus fermentans]|uniref:Uncharacterized protein DUF2019 n=1 Tax=Roseiarcus fermentans TaxID=1473586 RepID=A0A366FI12_9HYPH|nr:DUF2019 domain-containing protein [Roseiarcus fermentans]RBP14298.1 uncharacterized protein DUF2019 [Roseiarcus fermentans]